MKITQEELRRQMAYVLSSLLMYFPMRFLALELLPRISMSEHCNASGTFVAEAEIVGGPLNGVSHLSTADSRDDAIRSALAGVVKRAFAIQNARTGKPQDKHAEAERQIGEQMAEQWQWGLSVLEQARMAEQAARDMRAHARKVDQELAQKQAENKQVEGRKRVLNGWSVGLDRNVVAALLADGKLLRRSSWPDDHFIYMVPGSHFTVSRAPLNAVLPEGTQVNYRTHIDRHYGDNQFGVYALTQEDLLACDWSEVYAAKPQEEVFVEVSEGQWPAQYPPATPYSERQQILTALDAASGAKDAGLKIEPAFTNEDLYSAKPVEDLPTGGAYDYANDQCNKPGCKYCEAHANMAELLGDDVVVIRPGAYAHERADAIQYAAKS